MPLRRHNDPPAGPMRRREDELEELLEHGSRNFRRYRRRAMIGYAILVIAGAAMGYWLLHLTDEIQVQRADSIRLACVEQNFRHDRTIAALDTLIAKVPPGRRERARQSRAGTVLLIESLAPRRDCEGLVRRSVKRPPK